MNKFKGPLIIIGMHRSGTSMLSRVLEDLGIFMGIKKDENNEALFFVKFNNWILRQVNASWDNPYNYKVAGENFRNLTIDLAERYICSIKRIEYFGIKNFFKYKSLKELDFPWGWKDPRNTFTLDVWSKIFPNAKILHIYRNPIDVAVSLKKRREKCLEKFHWSIKKEIKFVLLRGYLGCDCLSPKFRDLMEGISLWEEYISRVFEIEETYDLDIIHIKYEDLLEIPKKNIVNILGEINLLNTVRESDIDNTVNGLNKGRRYAFLGNDYLGNIYEHIRTKNLMRKLGYDNIR